MSISSEAVLSANPRRREFLKGGVFGLLAAGTAGATPASAQPAGTGNAPSRHPKKSREEWRETLYEIPVFDTHSHLNNPGVPVGARDIWDILHYFWFERELQSVGYPRNAATLDETARIDRFVHAYDQARNTTWSLVVRQTLRDLYGVDLGNAGSVREADAAVRETAADSDWHRRVLDLQNIRRVTVNSERQPGPERLDQRIRCPVGRARMAA